MGKITLKLQFWHDSLTTQTADLEFHLSWNMLSANLFADVYDVTWLKMNYRALSFSNLKTNVK